MALQNVTLAQLRADLFAKVDSSRHWTNEEARIALNDVLLFWNLLTGQWRRTITLTFTAPQGDGYLPLPDSTTLIWPMRMERSDGTPIERASITSLNLAIPRWRGHATDDGGAIPTSVQYWAARSLQLVVLYPKPAATTNVILDGVADTPVLTADGDFVDLDEGILDTVLECAAHWLQFKDGGPKFENTIPALQSLILLAGDLNDQIRSTNLYRRAQGRDTDRLIYARTRPLNQAQMVRDRARLERAQQGAEDR